MYVHGDIDILPTSPVPVLQSPSNIVAMAAKPGVDLERELNCSICTDLLFQPLTLLDCLHTFCGSCLKDWFEWQKTSAETSPTPPSPGANVYTCPSCRAAVRDTRRNATVTSLLDIFIASNPEKARDESEQEELRQKYKPGDNVLPPVHLPERSAEERRADQLERQMIEQARDLSLRDIGVEPSSRSHREHSRSGSGRSRSSNPDGSQDARRHRARRGDERRHRTDSNGLLQPDDVSSEERRQRRSESRNRSDHHQPSSAVGNRHVEHQSSIRSLINTVDVSNGDPRDLEREIEEFARQIQEEGLLDGLDLDNIDLNNNDELSRKITEAYRRRQRERARVESGGRGAATAPQSRSQPALPLLRPPTSDVRQSSSRERSSSAQDGRSRPPGTPTRLEVPGESQRRRQRASSTGRTATDPVRPRTAETRPAARSQTDLTLRSHSSDAPDRRPSLAEGRSTSMPVESPTRGAPSTTTTQPGNETRDLSFSGRASAVQASQNPVPQPLFSASTADDSGSERAKRRRQRPASLVVAQSPLPSLGLVNAPTQRPRQPRAFYPEPSITCSTCRREHIEYEIHYNCAQCAGGKWNICQRCYRESKGCFHWFGFGYAALRNWERRRAASASPLEPQHILTANRYNPAHSAPGGADGRKTLTTEDPELRLESGLFCVRCGAWANECYWRCHVCNEGDWGFCNLCVNQGNACTHPLLPLTYVPPASPLPSPSISTASPANTPPESPGLGQQRRQRRRPRSATLLFADPAEAGGDWKPLTFVTTCDVCSQSIPPFDRRYHCNACTSTLVKETQPGDYDVCFRCYGTLLREGRISADNGPAGWRRCLRGHRMSIFGFVEGKAGKKRVVMRDVVGGIRLWMEDYGDGSEGLEKWCWMVNGKEVFRLVTKDVGASLPSPEQEAGMEIGYPPDGGEGGRGTATWAWNPAPGAVDELLFPRGAEIREIRELGGEGEGGQGDGDGNGDEEGGIWSFGAYMGAKGLFPSAYVRLSVGTASS
ncbi:hypothetical protein F5Y17DRAFT_332518 [Xylariaceae sp. FL0594]|nr:hypothetical protein F5Y17DRAFT_332518 [Xylariaceae sp. FL0594]